MQRIKSNRTILAAVLVMTGFSAANTASANDSPYIGAALVSKSFNMGGKGAKADINSTVPAGEIYGGVSFKGFDLSASYIYGSGQSINGTMHQYDLSASYPLNMGHNLTIAPAMTIGRLDVNSDGNRAVKTNYVLLGAYTDYRINRFMSVNGSLMTGRNANPYVAGLTSTSGMAYRGSAGVKFDITKNVDVGMDLEYTEYPMGNSLKVKNWNTSGSVTYKF